MTSRSAWRTNDVVAYDAMRESASMLLSLLVATSTVNDADHDANAREIEALRDHAVGVQAYDRGAVSALSVRIVNRIAELTEAQQ